MEKSVFSVFKAKTLTQLHIFSLLASCFIFSGTAGEISSPFWANEIEVNPGEKLMLRPRIIGIDDLPDEQYNLVLSFPEGIKKSELKTNYGDYIRKANCVETEKELIIDGSRQTEFKYKLSPQNNKNISPLGLSVELFSGSSLSTEQIFYFNESFQEKEFKKEFIVPGDVIKIKPRLWKMGNVGCDGNINLYNMKITEAKSGNTIVDFSPAVPFLFSFRSSLEADGSFILKEPLAVKGGEKYIISCRISLHLDKKEEMKNVPIFKNQPHYTKLLIFDTDKLLRLPTVLEWRIEDNSGKIFKKGTVVLVSGKTPAIPNTLETSVWCCETHIDKETPEIRELYLQKFRAWGLNRVEIELNRYGIQYGTSYDLQKLPTEFGEQAARMKFKVRGRSPFFTFLWTQSYLDSHPEVRAIDYKGDPIMGTKGISNRIPVCITWLLEGGKFDRVNSGEQGGLNNPLISYYADYIKQSFKVNNIDGLFFDFEMGNGLYQKSKPLRDGSRDWRNVTCVCERCRRSFAAYESLNYIPSVKELCDTGLYEKWINFRCHQNIQTWRIWRNVIKEINKDYTFSIYSNGPSDATKQRYGVNFKEAADTGTINYVMSRVYDSNNKISSEFYDSIKNGNSRTFLQLQVFPYADQDPTSLDKALPLIKNRILRLVVLGRSYGWAFNGIWCADDQLIKPLREANEIIAKYEDLFVKGEKVDFLVKGNLPANVSFSSWIYPNGKVVTFVFNDNPEEKEIELTFGTEVSKVKTSACNTSIYEWNK